MEAAALADAEGGGRIQVPGPPIAYLSSDCSSAENGQKTTRFNGTRRIRTVKLRLTIPKSGPQGTSEPAPVSSNAADDIYASREHAQPTGRGDECWFRRR